METISSERHAELLESERLLRETRKGLRVALDAYYNEEDSSTERLLDCVGGYALPTHGNPAEG
jgi:hypothetical protein